MKKSLKSFIALATVPLFVVALAFAGEAKVESKVAGCCAKAAKADKKCEHECCVAAAKDGMNCTKCKGLGPIVKKEKK
ncbi:MAG: hypothetical protein HY736_04775 [Verrucomicrobia bacterium]|nr:hypothetical protein [Verrucomicrobiota bacterium]